METGIMSELTEKCDRYKRRSVRADTYGDMRKWRRKENR
jgi:hypothetical protein